MNNIYTHDFGSLKSESLRIDYIRWNLVSLTPDQIYKSASYFKTLGFNSYQKDRDSSKSRQEITFDRRNLHEVVFILKINYQEGTHIEFSGPSANRIFDIIKQERLQWQKLLQHKAVLRRIDVCYDRPQKSTDQISNSRFINESLQQFQESHLNQNLSFFKNQNSHQEALPVSCLMIFNVKKLEFNMQGNNDKVLKCRATVDAGAASMYIV